ncbi:MAG: hypothetical protein ACYCZK_04630, partial [Microbacteriaceae bacterium]
MTEASAPLRGENRSVLSGAATAAALPVYPSRRELRAAQTAHSGRPATALPAKQAMHRQGAAAPMRRREVTRTAADLALVGKRIKARLPVSRKAAVKRTHSRVIVMMAMLFAPGLFVTLALPAYAYSPAPAAASGVNPAGAAGTQSLVAGGVQAGQVTRDGFTATSGQQLQNLRNSALRASRIASYL